MKRSFEITLFEEGDEAVCYTVKFENEELTESEKFMMEHEESESESFEDIYWRLEYMIDEHLFLPPMLKIEEGNRADWVVAIKTIEPKHLRWYGLRYNDRIMILGNGGLKLTNSYQEDANLHRFVKDLQYVNRCIEKRMRYNEIEFNNETNRITGNLIFPVEQFEDIDYPNN